MFFQSHHTISSIPGNVVPAMLEMEWSEHEHLEHNMISAFAEPTFSDDF